MTSLFHSALDFALVRGRGIPLVCQLDSWLIRCKLQAAGRAGILTTEDTENTESTERSVAEIFFADIRLGLA